MHRDREVPNPFVINQSAQETRTAAANHNFLQENTSSRQAYTISFSGSTKNQLFHSQLTLHHPSLSLCLLDLHQALIAPTRVKIMLCIKITAWNYAVKTNSSLILTTNSWLDIFILPSFSFSCN